MTASMGTRAAGDRLAIAADGPEISVSISTRAARAPFFLIFEQDGRMAEPFQNPVVEQKGGASQAAAELLDERNVGTLVASQFGEKMVKALQDREIKPVVATGAVADYFRNLIR